MLNEKEIIENRALIHEIVDIFLDTNGLESRQKRLTGTLPTAFMEFSGHVSSLDFTLFPHGWDSLSYNDRHKFYFDKPIKPELVKELRMKCDAVLSDINAVAVLEKEVELKEYAIAKEQEKLLEMKKRLRLKKRGKC